MRALLKGAHLHGAVRLWSRHATPRAFSHLVVTGPTGKALLNAIDPAASGLFVFHHPTLGNWAAVPAQFKQPDGTVLHQFAGVTPIDGGSSLSAAQFAALDCAELYVLGHVERYVSGHTRDGTPLLGLELTTATLLDAVTPAAVVWRSDSAVAWADVAAQYKRGTGAPRVDPDTARSTALVQWVDPVVNPPAVP